MDKENYIEKLILGNHEAFRKIFMTYFPKVKFFISQIVKSDIIAEELSQDIFMKIWENREDLIRVDSFNSYVYKMSKNAALNHLRRVYLEETYLENYVEKMEVTIEEEIYAHDIELLEKMVMSNMPKKRRTIYEMSRKYGLCNDEIALKLNITKKTVENQLNLALKEMRKIIYTILILGLPF